MGSKHYFHGKVAIYVRTTLLEEGSANTDRHMSGTKNLNVASAYISLKIFIR